MVRLNIDSLEIKQFVDEVKKAFQDLELNGRVSEDALMKHS
jgi:hypothetical protein